jgi:hypothetical protein
MLESLTLFSGDWITDLMIAITVTLFAFFLIRELLSTRSELTRLRELSELKSISRDNSIPVHQLTGERLVWVTDNLMYRERNGVFEFESKDGKWLSKTPISQMIPAFDPSRYKLVPALLTSIGITGTFLGITLGLSEFSMAGDSKALLSSAAELLEGMKTAFYTSLAGLSTSAIFMTFMKVSSSRLSRAQRRFTQLMSTQYFEATALMYLKKMSNESQDQVIAAQLRSTQIMEDLGHKMEDTVDSLGRLGESFNGEVIGKVVSVALTESIETKMSPALDAIKNELATLKDIKQQNQKELLDILIGEMKTQLIEPVTTELSKTAQAIENNNEISAQLNNNVEKVMTSTAETVEIINKFQLDTMTKLQDFAESLKDILGSFKQDTQGAMSQIAAEVKTMLEDASLGMEGQRIAFGDSTKQAASAFLGIRTEMEQALSDRQVAEHELFASVEKRVGNLLSSLGASFDEQTQVIKQTGESAATLMSSAKSELEQGLGDIDSKVKSMSQTVQHELETFRLQYQENLTGYFDQQNNLLEDSLGKQRDGLNGVVDNFRKVFEQEYQTRHNLLQELTAQYEKLQAAAKTIEQVAKAIGLNEASKMAELQDAAQTMGREIAQLKREYGKAAATFTDVTENLPKAMDEYFTRANKSFEEFFSEFDQAASSIHNKLSQSAGYLINSQVQRREFESDEVNAS